MESCPTRPGVGTRVRVHISDISSSSTTSYVTRFITLAPIFLFLSPLELNIFLLPSWGLKKKKKNKEFSLKIHFLLSLLYFLRDQLHTPNICSLSSSTSYVMRFITLAPMFLGLSPLELRNFLKNTIYYCFFFISKGINFILQIYVPYHHSHFI
jgi:hypothetical protein